MGLNEELFEAVKKGDMEEVRELLENGADVNAKSIDGSTPLHYAAHHGHVDVARLLIENGADVNAKSNDGSTPLHDAAHHGQVDAARLLIENGADVNAKSNYDSTPLHWAAWGGHVDFVRLLIEKGADVNAEDNDGKTPIDIAHEKGHRNIVKLLERAREEAVPHIELLGFEQDEIEAGKWGRLRIRLRANKPVTASVNLSGDVDWLNPGVVKLSGESLIEVPVKPKIVGEIPAQVTLTYGDKKTSSITWIKAGGNSYQRCPKCNAQIEPEAKYCWRCGANLA
jgi:ankyrin repeat protein